MLKGQYSRGPVCETLERTQQLFTEERVDRVRMGTANRVLEAFDHRPVMEIAAALKIDCETVRSVISGDALPATEMLIAIKEVTGVSIDWLLSGYSAVRAEPALPTLRLDEPVHLGLA